MPTDVFHLCRLCSPCTHWGRASAWVALLAVGCGLFGCGAPGIRPSSLPPDLLAKRRQSVANLNLASVAVPGAADAQIAPGDLLEVTIASGRAGEEPQPSAARVADDGTVDVLLVGPVPVAGLEATAAEQAITRASVERGIYRRPHVSVDLKAKAVHRVTVLGAVDSPGVHELSRTNCNLVAALAAAGGLTDEAGPVVEVVRQPVMGPSYQSAVAQGVQQVSYQRPGATPAHTQRIDLTSGGTATCQLADRDVVVVKQRDKEMIYVAGLVKSPGQFELPTDQQLRLLDAIALAGGLDSPVADQVLVVRNMPGRTDPTPISCSVAAAKRSGAENLVLAPGDAISVEQTPATAVVDTFRDLFRMTFGIAGRSTVF